MGVLDAERQVTLGGATRVMRMDFNALCRAEEITNRNYTKGQTWGDLSARDYRALIFGCLVAVDPEVTVEDVGRWLTMGDDTEKAMSALLELWIGNAGAKSVDETKEAEERPTGTAGESGGQ